MNSLGAASLSSKRVGKNRAEYHHSIRRLG